MEQLYPEIRQVITENRTFIRNAVTWATGQGIDQFIDIGAEDPYGYSRKDLQHQQESVAAWWIGGDLSGHVSGLAVGSGAARALTTSITVEWANQDECPPLPGSA
jgi:hypothetical protein